MMTLLAYRPLIDPMPIQAYWLWLVIPLCLLFSVVYKSVKCNTIDEIPRASLEITFWILLAMGSVAVGLALLVRVM